MIYLIKEQKYKINTISCRHTRAFEGAFKHTHIQPHTTHILHSYAHTRTHAQPHTHTHTGARAHTHAALAQRESCAHSHRYAPTYSSYNGNHVHAWLQCITWLMHGCSNTPLAPSHSTPKGSQRAHESDMNKQLVCAHRNNKILCERAIARREMQNAIARENTGIIMRIQKHGYIIIIMHTQTCMHTYWFMHV